MAIDPVHSPAAGSTGASASQAGGTQQAAPEALRNATVRQGASECDHGDTIQLSTTSLSLQAQASGGAPPSGTMSAAQMRSVLGRVVSGYYDQPAARDAVAQGVAADLGASGAA